MLFILIHTYPPNRMQADSISPEKILFWLYETFLPQLPKNGYTLSRTSSVIWIKRYHCVRIESLELLPNEIIDEFNLSTDLTKRSQLLCNNINKFYSSI